MGVIDGLAGAGGFNLAAWAMVVWRMRGLGPRSPASPGLVMAALAFGMACAVPLAPWLALGLAGVGVGLLVRRDTTDSGREAGWLLVLLGICWGAPFAKPVHMLIARFDAVMAAVLVRLAGGQAEVVGNIVGLPNFSVEVFTVCASSTPLPEVLLAFVVVVLYCGDKFRRAQIKYLAASFAMSILLSEIRLALMVPSRADWRYWHFDGGATIYQLVALVSALFWPYLATLRRPVAAAMTVKQA